LWLIINLEKQFEQIREAPIDFLHYDVVDGSFNRCIILGLPLLAAIRPHIRLPIDVHLAVYPIAADGNVNPRTIPL
jgi:ribulose-phosphate 3-epimerase